MKKYGYAMVIAKRLNKNDRSRILTEIATSRQPEDAGKPANSLRRQRTLLSIKKRSVLYQPNNSRKSVNERNGLTFRETTNEEIKHKIEKFKTNSTSCISFRQVYIENKIESKENINSENKPFNFSRSNPLK